MSTSQSILDLIGNALQVVRIAFRIGVKVNDIALRLSIIVKFMPIKIGQSLCWVYKKKPPLWRSRSSTEERCDTLRTTFR